MRRRRKGHVSGICQTTLVFRHASCCAIVRGCPTWTDSGLCSKSYSTTALFQPSPTCLPRHGRCVCAATLCATLTFRTWCMCTNLSSRRPKPAAQLWRACRPTPAISPWTCIRSLVPCATWQPHAPLCLTAKPLNSTDATLSWMKCGANVVHFVLRGQNHPTYPSTQAGGGQHRTYGIFISRRLR